jgi:hypothetical protein
MKRDYEINEMNEIDERAAAFRLFRSFRLFRNLLRRDTIRILCEVKERDSTRNLSRII